MGRATAYAITLQTEIAARVVRWVFDQYEVGGIRRDRPQPKREISPHVSVDDQEGCVPQQR